MDDFSGGGRIRRRSRRRRGGRYGGSPVMRKIGEERGRGKVVSPAMGFEVVHDGEGEGGGAWEKEEMDPTDFWWLPE
ncbi:hypothetical protein HAX54_016212 [Datura stramonium]|uniref:Uncharacterized protein n=1 Tax=Datura stramonium TaxID=4076 RepID=A0ABS8UKE5_DATST|nr:hypothetical protein [Datura stramonium]